jgi:hypothetical protein
LAHVDFMGGVDQQGGEDGFFEGDHDRAFHLRTSAI